MRHIDPARPVALRDGRRLVVRDGAVGVVDSTGAFAPLPADEEIAFDGALFVPPTGTRQRAIEGQLGRYRFVLGDGYALHGTPDRESIGRAVTHGCIRVDDEALEWLWAHVPIGTRVRIY